jgi:hypothetical protein
LTFDTGTTSIIESRKRRTNKPSSTNPTQPTQLSSSLRNGNHGKIISPPPPPPGSQNNPSHPLHHLTHPLRASLHHRPYRHPRGYFIIHLRINLLHHNPPHPPRLHHPFLPYPQTLPLGFLLGSTMGGVEWSFWDEVFP